MWPLFVLIVLIVLYFVFRIIADEDIERSNKKVEDYYKKREEEREAEFREMYTIVEDDAEE